MEPMANYDEDAIADFLADPQKYKKLWFEEIRREYPHWTDLQLETSWALLARTVGVDE